MRALTLFSGIIILISVAFCDDTSKEGDNQIQSESQLPIIGPDQSSHVDYDYPIGPQNYYYRNWHSFDRYPSGPDPPCYHHLGPNRYPPFDHLNHERFRYPDWNHRQYWNNFRWAYERNPGLFDDRQFDGRRFVDHNYGPNSYGYEYSLPGGGFTYFHRNFHK